VARAAEEVDELGAAREWHKRLPCILFSKPKKLLGCAVSNTQAILGINHNNSLPNLLKKFFDTPGSNCESDFFRSCTTRQLFDDTR
jgi:hypothetical protein